MTESRTPPHNLDAEESLLGAMLLSQQAAESALRILGPEDFYKPAHGLIFSAVAELYTSGAKLDAVTVSNLLGKRGQLDAIGGPATLLSLQTRTPTTSNAPQYANIVLDMAQYRRAIAVAQDLVAAAYDMAGPPADLMERSAAELTSVGIRVDDLPPDLWVLDEFLDRPEAVRPDWCIPGLIRKGWRIIVVAGEGAGKTTLFRQMAIAASQGIHPLRFEPITPCRSLIVDLENPEDSILDVCNPIRDRVSREADDYDSQRAWLWHRPGGMNFRNRQDRIALESVIRETKPDLVCLGPLYKAYEVSARESDEIAAREVMHVFDDLRTRYNFGLMMEHHAPKESGGSKRKMMPYGTSLWLRWPEMGISMTPEGQGVETMAIGRWRGDRLDNDWPIRLHRSLTWPWQGEFEESASATRPTPMPASTPVYDDPYDDDDEGDDYLDSPF